MKKSFISVFLFLLLAVVILPVVAKVSGPEGNIDQNSSTFSWSGNDSDGTIAKYEYRKDGGAWTNHALNTSYTWSDYTEGAHTFEVRAQDNEGAYSNIIIWNFTYQPPNPVIRGLVLSKTVQDFPRPPLFLGIEEVIINFSGVGSTTTGPFGHYSMEVPYGWSGTVTPVMSQCLFSPPRVSLNNVTGDCSRNFYLSDELVLVEHGTFMMGDEFGDLFYWTRPIHEVTLTYDFYIGKYETTFDQYDAFCEATGRSKPDDKGLGRGTRPVMHVSWWDAIAYCNWLSAENGLPVAYRLEGEVNEGQLLDSSGNVTKDITEVVGFRLPTEAEWEYAARGGKHHSPYRYSGSNNGNDVGWYRENSGDMTHEVGEKAPNELGIYDMSGNVNTWCSDWFGDYSDSAQTNPYNSTAGSYRVYRGGCAYLNEVNSRVAHRVHATPTFVSGYNLGFRICRTVP